MSTKKTSWADNIADSNLPADDFTWTEGSNYGLDGFYHTQTMGEGTRNRGDQSGLSGPISPGQSKGMSALPDGLIGGEADSFDDEDLPAWVGDEDGVVLSDMLDEGSIPLTAAEETALSLADLSWLDPTQKQDPARLPKELRPDLPPLNSIPELEEAWGVDRRTDGLRLLPNQDKAIADYERSIESGLPATPGVEKNAHDLAWHIQKATRLSHYGRSITEIHDYLTANLGDTPLAAQAFKQIQANHGLMGSVYILASAFPGLKNGKWVKQIKKSCRQAKYVVTESPLVASKLGLPAVKSVDWERALNAYRPVLLASGYKVATQASPKKTLQLAFLLGPEAPKAKESHKPVDVRPADRISTAEARRAFQMAPKPVRQVITKDESSKARQRVLGNLEKAKAAGLLSAEEVFKLSQSSAHPAQIKRVAEQLARINLMSRKGHYMGEGTNAQVMSLHRRQEWGKLAQAELDEAQLKKAHKYIAQMVESGQITTREAKRAMQESTAEGVLKYAAAFANNAGTRKASIEAAKPSKQFDGPVFRQAMAKGASQKKLSAEDQKMHAAAAASGIKVSEFRLLGSWLRRQMSEGLAGNTLTDLMRHRFASPLRVAAEYLVSSLRSEHEGLSGHLYVDAEVYAQGKKGTTGCEEGALKHRANTIPYVRRMAMCEGCVFANAEGRCTKYNKALLAELPADARVYQQQMIQASDAPDYESTAALFDASEFNLGDPLAELDLDEPAITEDIGDVFFGGFEI